MSDAVLEDLEDKIKKLNAYDITSCMKLYDTLSSYAKGLYQNVTDSQIKHIVSRIMTSKQTLLDTYTEDLHSLQSLSYEEKRVLLNPLTLNHDYKFESNQLWRFLKSEDVDTQEKRNSLGIEKKLNNNIKDADIDVVDNLFAKCICRLDIFIKHFVFMRPTGDASRVRMQTFDGKTEHANMELMLRMLLETATNPPS